MNELSAKRFADFHSDWPNGFLGPRSPVRGHRNLKCVYTILQRYANKMRGIAWTLFSSISQDLTVCCQNAHITQCKINIEKISESVEII